MRRIITGRGFMYVVPRWDGGFMVRWGNTINNVTRRTITTTSTDTQIRRHGHLAIGCGCLTLLVLSVHQWRRKETNTTYAAAAHVMTTTAQQPPSTNNELPLLHVEYSPRDRLGKGSFGAVFKAKERDLGQVALKIMTRNEPCVMYEVETMKRVRDAGSHPNIMKLLGVISIADAPDKIGLVFELARGGELYDNLVANGAYSEKESAAMVRQVASALDFLHNTARVVHADLKPENLLLKDDSTIAICDFGSAVMLDAKGKFLLSAKRPLGTVAYAAPELLKPRATQATPAIDVWSLGVLLFVMLSGTHPFDPDNELLTDEELTPPIVRGTFHFDAPVWNNISEEAKSLIRRMLTSKPENRISAKEILEHVWVKADTTSAELLEGSDVRLRGFLNTQRRVQQKVFALMVHGLLKDPKLDAEAAKTKPPPLDNVWKQFDVEGKGFITPADLSRFSVNGDTTTTPAVTTPPPPGTSSDEKIYYRTLNGIVGIGEICEIPPNVAIFEEGDPPDAFYFINRGRIQVSVGGKVVDEIGPGDFFGEIGLIRNTTRIATVVAGNAGAQLIKFSKRDFDLLREDNPSVCEALENQVRSREVDHIKKVYTDLFYSKKVMFVGSGGVVLQRGDASDSMYYIVDGYVDVIGTKGTVLARRKAGDTVGELGLVTGSPRSNTVVCTAEQGCMFKRLYKEDLDRLLAFSAQAKQELENALTRSRDGDEARNKAEKQAAAGVAAGGGASAEGDGKKKRIKRAPFTRVPTGVGVSKTGDEKE